MNINASFPVEIETPTGRNPIWVTVEKRRWFILLVVLPTIAGAIYFGLIASNVYVSESSFVIKSSDQKRSQISTLANLVQTTGLSGGQEETNEILTYVRSRDALKALEKDTNIRSRYSQRGADMFARFPKLFSDDSFENLFRYYGDMVSANFDTENGTAVIRVKAFAPQDAYAINERLLGLSESLVNRLNNRAQSKAIVEAQKQVELATGRALTARTALAQYRNSQALIDPNKQAVSVLEISNTMIAQRAGLQAQLDLMQRLAPRNPSIPALRDRIRAMSVQIGAQDSRLVGGGNGIASKMGGYESLFVEQEFATQSMTAANTALVQARAEAQRQQFYLERVADPNIPDSPALPKRLLDILVVAAAALCIYFILWMFTIGVLEHASED